MYDIRSFSRKGTGAAEKSNEYGSLSLSTRLEGYTAVLEDIITVSPEGMEDVPKNFSWIFDRTIVFAANNLLVPKTITIDMTIAMDGKRQTVHQFNFENGVAKYIEEDSTRGTEKLDFSRGILTFNALLRLTPLLPRSPGDVYAFNRSDEMFLFHIHTADKTDPMFTLRCDSLETIKIGARRYDCVKFELQQKSVPDTMDIWVDRASNVVVKFWDGDPDGADAYRLEATLKE
jgi:hypothetical protein